MIAWESTITREERIQLASYIISMQGTKPAAPKAAEGEIIWPVAEVVEEAVEEAPVME